MISLDGIVKYFHKGSVNEVFALNNVDLHIDEGDFVKNIKLFSGSFLPRRLNFALVITLYCESTATVTTVTTEITTTVISMNYRG